MQKEEEKKFKEVGEAFSVLSDAKKKSRYDSGQDLEDDGMNMGGQHLGKPWGGRSRGWTDWSTSPLWANEPPFLLANSCFYGESLTGKFSVTMLLFFVFCLHQILMPTTFSKRSSEALGVLALKVIHVCKKMKEIMLLFTVSRSHLRIHQLLTCLLFVSASGPGNFFFQFG